MTGMTGAAVLPAPYTSQEALGETRRQVEDLVCGMPGADPSQMGFQHPWEIRAFAMAVAAHKALKFDWSEFQGALIASIQEWEAHGFEKESWSYYEHWVAALESVMEQRNAIPVSELDSETQRILAQPANRNHHEAHTEPVAIDPARG